MTIESGLITGGAKATEKHAIAKDIANADSFSLRVKCRMMSEEEFIENHSSGTLRKNKKLGFHYKKQYLHERICFEFGYGFECVHESHINWGQPITEGDCSAITEAGWFINRYQFIAFPGDKFEAKYIQVHSDNETKEGVGIIIRNTSAFFVPDGYVVFAIIARVDTIKHMYFTAVNPC